MALLHNGKRGDMKKGMSLFLAVSLIFSTAALLCAQDETAEDLVESVRFTEEPATVAKDSSGPAAFIGNAKTRKVHRETCGLGKRTSDKNRILFATYDEAVERGFVPCKRCNPDEPLIEKKVHATGSPADARFIGNRETRKVHRSECSHVERMADDKKVYFAGYEEALESGFAPCRICDPDKVALEEKIYFSGTRKEATANAPFVGNRETRKIHRRSCTHAKNLADEKAVYFEKYRDTIEAGFIPCRVCDPDKAALEAAFVQSSVPGRAYQEAPIVQSTSQDEVPARAGYIGNRNSKKLHVASCAYGRRTSEQNRVYFDSFEKARKLGFIPCKICRPDRQSLSGVPPASSATRGLSSGAAFVGNIKSKKLHRPDCRHAVGSSYDNRMEFTSLRQALDAGYIPCKICNPSAGLPATAPRSTIAEQPPVIPAPPPPARKAVKKAVKKAAPKVTKKPAKKLDKKAVKKPAEKAAEEEYVGSRNGKTFHRPTCEWAKYIASRNRVTYPDREAAIAGGKIPCRVCKP